MIIKYIKKVSRLKLRDKYDLALIYVLYFKYQIIVKLLPLKFYKHNFYSSTDSKTSMQLNKGNLRLIKGVRSILPFTPRCLVDSLVVRNYFQRQNIDIPILLGVQNNTGLKAHAWCKGLNANGYNQNIFVG